jgi:hypothetical protein
MHPFSSETSFFELSTRVRLRDRYHVRFNVQFAYTKVSILYPTPIVDRNKYCAGNRTRNISQNLTCRLSLIQLSLPYIIFTYPDLVPSPS